MFGRREGGKTVRPSLNSARNGGMLLHVISLTHRYTAGGYSTFHLSMVLLLTGRCNRSNEFYNSESPGHRHQLKEGVTLVHSIYALL